jgi:uncharacterized protein (TIGR03663 family)
MATAGEERLGVQRLSNVLDRYGLDWVHVVVGNVTLVALVARLYDLGGRVAHWDEARVAYWTLEYIETGNFEYRPIIHGPFYHHVNRPVFEALGATDVTMRLVVAVLTGFFPLVALLFRDRLRDGEVAALAGFFALNPVLLYYSRFMRGDPLVAVFMFAAFALFVRALDTRRIGYLDAAVIFTALGFTVKENALLYLVCWAGAGALLLDDRLLQRDEAGWSWPGDVSAGARRVGGFLRRRYEVVLFAAVEFLVVIVFFYAPRRASESGPGLWTVFADPTVAPEVFFAATVGPWQDLWSQWISGDHQGHAYLPYLSDFLGTMAHGALALSIFAVVGFVADRYTGDGPSDLVPFCSYWGFASVLGYPLVTDIQAPWATVNAVVPLAVPAAVGFGLIARWSYRAAADADYLTAGFAAFALLIVVGQVAGASVGAVYLNPQSEENELVQYAQPAGDVDPEMEVLAATAPDNQGPDIVLAGEYFVDGGGGAETRDPVCAKWFNSLPLPWYVAAADAEVQCVADASEVSGVVAESEPPVVVVRGDGGQSAGDLDGYVSRTHLIRAWDTEVRFYVREAYADDLPPVE